MIGENIKNSKLIGYILCRGSVLCHVSASLRWAEDSNEVVPIAIIKLGMSHIETMHNEWVGIVLLLTKLNRCHVVQSQLRREKQ